MVILNELIFSNFVLLSNTVSIEKYNPHKTFGGHLQQFLRAVSLEDTNLS